MAVRTVVAGLCASVIVVIWQVATWPDVAALETKKPSTTAFIERARARAVAVEWRWVAYDDVSDDLKRAVIVAEDINFFSHRGFEVAELKVAAREAIRGERLRGASTITQQLAKNLWLKPSRSPLRKLREAVLTWQLERSLSKRRILELYLNVAELGPGVFGAEAAAGRYFGISAAELDRRQAAQLAASLPRPATWHPGSTGRGYARYVDQLLVRMERADWLDGEL